MRLLALTRKDLTQILRDRRSAIFLIAMPVVFTVFLGFAFRWSGQTDSRPYVGIVNLDSDTLVLEALRMLLDSSGLVRNRVYEPRDTARVEGFVRQQRLDAALIIPPDYFSRLLSGVRSPLTVIGEENSPDGQAAYRAVMVAAGRLNSSAAAARIVSSVSDTLTSTMTQRLSQAVARWQKPAFRVEQDSAAPATRIEKQRLPTSFQQASPGTLVQFAIFSLLTSVMLLVTERRNRVLARLLTTPVAAWEVVVGHLLAMFCTAFVPGLVLLGFGELVFRVGYIRNPAAVLVVLTCLSLWVTGLGLMVGTLARSQEQVTAWAMISMFALSALGGCWFPLELTGRTFAAVGHILPSAQAMQGFQNIAVRGLGFGSVLVPCTVMLGYAALFLTVAALRFRADAG